MTLSQQSRSGDISEVVTPVTIPNTEVKHFSVDNSLACLSEDRSLPVIKKTPIGCLFFNIIVSLVDQDMSSNSSKAIRKLRLTDASLKSTSRISSHFLMRYEIVLRCKNNESAVLLISL